jgi:plasmid stability protein
LAEVERAALNAAGCDVIRAEKASGTRRDGRTELQVLLDFLRPGDALVITRIDRLARSLKDLQDIVHERKERRVALSATEQPINTGTAAGKAFLDMLGVFAEFETNLRKAGGSRAYRMHCIQCMHCVQSMLMMQDEQSMATITVRNVDPALKERLRVRAALHGQSMEAELRQILQDTLKEPERAPEPNLAEAIRRRFAPFGGVDLELPSDEMVGDPPSFEP